MKLEMRVLIAPADPAADPHPIVAIATNLNRHGALIASDRELKASSYILLTNRQKQTATAKVVSQAGQKDSLRHYGIEFLHNDAGESFWGITFPGS